MHEFAAFEKAPYCFRSKEHAQSMGEGRAMRLATRDFYAMGHDGDTSSIRTFGARGREIGAKSTRIHDANLALYDSVLGTTDRGPE